MASKLHLELALTPDGWRRDVVVRIDHGVILGIEEPGRGEAQRVSGVVLPGLPNLHSHAFQRAMAGLTERRGSEADIFWTWREAMYRFVERLTPGRLEAIAAFAYMEMLEAGFTGSASSTTCTTSPTAGPTTMSPRCRSASWRRPMQPASASPSCPCSIARADFGGKPPTPAQRRFVNDRDSLRAARWKPRRRLRGSIGIAPHSLRAVTLDDLQWAVRSPGPASRRTSTSPSRRREVDDCIAAHGRRTDRPAARHGRGRARAGASSTPPTPTPMNGRASPGPRPSSGFARSPKPISATACSTLPRSWPRAASFGVGSDSLVRISAADELRTLEYGQRLMHRQRNVLGEATRSTGRRLFEAALAGGARATDALTMGGIAPGKRADFVVLDRQHPSLAAAQDDSLLDAWLFAADNAAIKTVYCRGVPVVQNGRHVARDELGARYRKALSGLA